MSQAKTRAKTLSFNAIPEWTETHGRKSPRGREGAWLEHRSHQARALSPAGRISHSCNISMLRPASKIMETPRLQVATEVSVKLSKLGN